MRVSNLGLNYSAGRGIEPRTMRVLPPNLPKANTHRFKPPGEGNVSDLQTT